MKAKKYGTEFHNQLIRKSLFFNRRKGLALDEVREYGISYHEKWWEVYAVEVSENTFSLVRKLVLATDVYSVAWDMVRDQNHIPRRFRGHSPDEIPHGRIRT